MNFVILYYFCLESPSRFDVLVSLFELSNHVRELWGLPLLKVLTKKNPLQTANGAGNLSSTFKVNATTRRSSNVSLGSRSTGIPNLESEWLSKCKSFTEYFQYETAKYAQDGVKWPEIESQIKTDQNNPANTAQSTLNKIKLINFKSALRLAGNKIIDSALFVYICVEVWAAEINLVER